MFLIAVFMLSYVTETQFDPKLIVFGMTPSAVCSADRILCWHSAFFMSGISTVTVQMSCIRHDSVKQIPKTVTMLRRLRRKLIAHILDVRRRKVHSFPDHPAAASPAAV
jgi:hypothetical protein